MAIFTLVAKKIGACGGVGPRTAGGPFLARPRISPAVMHAQMFDILGYSTEDVCDFDALDNSL